MRVTQKKRKEKVKGDRQQRCKLAKKSRKCAKVFPSAVFIWLLCQYSYQPGVVFALDLSYAYMRDRQVGGGGGGGRGCCVDVYVCGGGRGCMDVDVPMKK